MFCCILHKTPTVINLLIKTNQLAPRLVFWVFLFIYLFCKWDLSLTEKYWFISVTWFYFVVFHLLKFLIWRVNSACLCHVLLFSAIHKLHTAAAGIPHLGLTPGPAGAAHCVGWSPAHTRRATESDGTTDLTGHYTVVTGLQHRSSSLVEL